MSSRRGQRAAYATLGALLLVGAALRGWFVFEDRPAFLGYPDSATYLGSAHTDIFAVPVRPGGYPWFLGLAWHLSHDLTATTVLQHLLGVATAVLLYLAVRRVTGEPWLGLIPAAVVLLGGLQLFVEHSILSEGPFAFLVAAALYCAVRWRDAQRAPWALGAGVLLGAATCVRSLGALVLALVVVWFGLTARTRPRRRALVAPGAVVAGAALALSPYVAVQARDTGYVGLVRGAGWALYARTGPFAQCARFRPPAGTRPLCERTPPDTRFGPDHYYWDDSSPAWKAFGPPPDGDGRLARFARAAIVHQPAAYLGAVGRDLARYVAPRAFQRAGGGFPPGDLISFLLSTPNENGAGTIVTRYYSNRAYHQHAIGALTAYGRAASVDGPAVGVLVLLALAAPLASRGRARAGGLLFAVVALALMVGPVATLYYDARYGVPAMGPLAAAAAVGAHALTLRVRERRHAGRPVSMGSAAGPARSG